MLLNEYLSFHAVHRRFVCQLNWSFIHFLIFLIDRPFQKTLQFITMLWAINKIPNKYRIMIGFASSLVTIKAFIFCLEKNCNLSEYLYILPFGLIIGGLFGSLIAGLAWLGEFLGIWTLPDPDKPHPPISWLRMLIVALSIFVILVLIGAYFGVV